MKKMVLSDEVMEEEQAVSEQEPRSALRRVLMVVMIVFILRVMILGTLLSEVFNTVAPYVVMSVCPAFSFKDFKRLPSFCGMLVVLMILLIFGRGEVRV